jgi:hypothetical protein
VVRVEVEMGTEIIEERGRGCLQIERAAGIEK